MVAAGAGSDSAELAFKLPSFLKLTNTDPFAGADSDSAELQLNSDSAERHEWIVVRLNSMHAAGADSDSAALALAALDTRTVVRIVIRLRYR